MIAGSPSDFGSFVADGNREVGQGDPSGQHQAGVISGRRTFHNSRFAREWRTPHPFLT